MDVIGNAKYAIEICKFCIPSLCKKVQIMHLIIVYEVQVMNEKNYKKRLDFQQKMIARYLEQIEKLKIDNEKLTLECQKKDEIIHSVESMRKEMTENIKEQRKLKEQYKALIKELKMMKNIINEEVYRKRWWLVRFFLK